MHIRDLLDDAPGGASVRNVAAAFGLDPAKAETAIDVMGQALIDRIERNTLSRGGLADLVELLERPSAGRALTDPGNLAAPQIAEAGNGVLGVLLGDKHLSRGIAAKAARESGLDEATLKRMLPAVASMLIGALQRKALGPIEKTVAKVPSLNLGEMRGRSPLPLPGERLPPASSQGGQGGGGWDTGLPQPAGGSGGGMGGTVGGSPLPIPGDDIPGINEPSRFPQLPDIVRKGGPQVPGPGGGSLDDIIRSILASVLGFKNGGILSWIVKLLLSRWFMGLVRRILSRVVLGR